MTSIISILNKNKNNKILENIKIYFEQIIDLFNKKKILISKNDDILLKANGNGLQTKFQSFHILYNSFKTK